MQRRIDPYTNQSNLVRSYSAFGLGLLVVSLILAGTGARAVKASGSLVGTVTLAGELVPAPVTRSTGSTAPVLLSPEEVHKLPEDVYEWLKHLEECERRRNELVQKQISEFMPLQALGSLGVSAEDFKDPEQALEKTPTGKALSETSSGPKSWDDLEAFFKAKVPPAECVPVRNAYSQALGETKASIEKVNKALQSATESGGDSEVAAKIIQDLMKLKDSNKASIDVAGTQADRLVQQICDKYKVPKWFEIKGDIGGGMGGILKGFGGQ